MQPIQFDWKVITESFAAAAQSLDGLAAAMAKMPRVVVTDEVWHALEQSGRLGWSVGFRWERDITRLVSYGERRRRPYSPRREKRRARKRRGKR